MFFKEICSWTPVEAVQRQVFGSGAAERFQCQLAHTVFL